MASFIDMSWKVDEDRRKREIAATAAATAALDGAAEQEALLPRLGLWRKTKEFFRPELRRKRALDEFAIAQRLDGHVDEPVEARRLQTVREEGETPTINDDYDDDDEITALPPMPGRSSTLPARRAARPFLPASEDDMDEATLEDVADQAMDEAFTAADSPGNRLSTRPALPAEWMAGTPRTLKTAMSDSSLRAPLRRDEFLPLPSAVFSPGSVPLPNLTVGEGRGGGKMAGEVESRTR